MTVSCLARLAGAETGLFATCLTLSRDRIVETRNAIDTVVADRACKVIDQKLNDPI